ncbi:MAG: GDP-mannose 4,6-dehydratase [Candidatus Komeilibacteria bacterium]
MKQVIFDKKNILVIGGAGFLGSHLCDELVKENKVICIDNFITSSVDNIRNLMQNPNFKFIKHDIKEPIDLASQPDLQKFKVEFQGIQEIYNLACPTSVNRFEELAIDILDANSLIMKNVLEMTKQYQAKFVQFSSSVVYGPRRDEAKFYSENEHGDVDFTDQRACYDEGKRFAETMAITYRDHFELPIRIARVFRTYGPRMLLNDGQMIPDFIIHALDNKDLIIYGDQSFTTTLAYVSDIVDGMIKVMEGEKNEIYNIGSDVVYTLEDVAKMVIQMTGSQSKIKYVDPLLFMTPLCKPDIKKVKQDLGWFPITSLKQGLAKTIDFARANKILSR